ncbi:MAG: hypothetical protein COU11_00390 [Candidatus Harrisonbacteria bacterium CG10_big_fil_rev_8_21_14_0_10_49_15]|uniref:Uncharacterized protein n=1 Tax=Candidatus Harrisonbacteria bacterium CG10_big_fil_rev_8_21_14_0_10_49_15 TaxID=1974587 RepID=A0A2H0UM20_9BACT|nr:MAG: hypothetical protein COU11_00390 [Candidatus Harrisonbacteria bacterium CG10_big_fil_rev_8_21_14_0_10_49_15]
MTTLSLSLPGGGTRCFCQGKRVRILLGQPGLLMGGEGVIHVLLDRQVVVRLPDGSVTEPIPVESLYLVPVDDVVA